MFLVEMWRNNYLNGNLVHILIYGIEVVEVLSMSVQEYLMKA